MNASPPTTAEPHPRAGNLSDALTPARCRLLLILFIVGGFFAHLHFLTHACPVDLSGDEAQYWDWSRRLDWSYYSKGPLVAWIIRASCAAFGQDSMVAVRFPALLLGAGTTLLTYLLTRKLFGSEKTALAAAALYCVVPMFAAGSVLMTIDPPFYFCWAFATYLAAIAIFDGHRAAWPAAGFIVGVGFLAKYAMLFWFVPVLVFLAFDPAARRQLRSAGPWLAIGIGLLLTAPVIAWNAQHGWLSFRHVSAQTGTDGTGSFSPLNLVNFIAGQLLILGPGMAVLVAAAVIWSFGGSRPRQVRFLTCLGLFFFGAVLLTGFITKAQPNWPLPAYFTLIILTAHFLALNWRRWRWLAYPMFAVGFAMATIAHNPEVIYPAARWLNAHAGTHLDGRRIDFSAKSKGWQQLAAGVERERLALGPDTFVICSDYQETAEMAFYLPGQPRTWYLGSWYRRSPKRLTQYDIWPDRNLDPQAGPAGRNPLLGRNAIFVGQFDQAPPELTEAFEAVFEPELTRPSDISRRRATAVDVFRGGLRLQSFRLIRCYGFRGLRRPSGNPAF